MSMPRPEQALVDVREMLDHELRVAVADVEVDVVEAEPLDLMVDRAGDHVARRELGALVEVRHEAVAGPRELQVPALAAHRLGDQEVLDLQIVEAGRVELHDLHVGDAAARPPRHGDAVAGRAARRGREEVGAARAAGREHGRAGGEQLTCRCGG
jgi:hypothetical protein